MNRCLLITSAVPDLLLHSFVLLAEARIIATHAGTDFAIDSIQIEFIPVRFHDYFGKLHSEISIGRLNFEGGVLLPLHRAGVRGGKYQPLCRKIFTQQPRLLPSKRRQTIVSVTSSSLP